MNLKFLHFSSIAACMALHLKKEMVPLVHAESVELLGMIRMVGIYSTFFQLGSLYIRYLSIFFDCLAHPNLKPLISSHSSPRTMAHIRLIKCFVLQHSVIKTKHLRSLLRGIVQGFK